MTDEGPAGLSAVESVETVDEPGRISPGLSEATPAYSTTRWATRLNRWGFGVLLLTLAILPFNGYSAEICRAGVMLAAAIWAGQCALKREIGWPSSGLHAVLLLYLGLSILQLIPLPLKVHGLPEAPGMIEADAGMRAWNRLSIDPVATWGAVSNLAGLVGLFFGTSYFLSNERRLRIAVHWTILIGVAIAIAGIFIELKPEGETLWAGSRYGFYFQPSIYVAFLEMVAGLVLGLMLGGGIPRDRTFLYGFFVVLIGTDLIVSRSRGAVMVLMFQFALVALLSYRVRQRHGRGESGIWGRLWAVAGSLIIAGGIGVGVVWIGAEPIRSKIATTGLEVEGFQRPEELPTSRAAMWRNALSLIRDYPVFGTGLGTFPTAYPRFDKAPGIFRTLEVHNDFLQVLCDSGAVGGILGLVFLFYLYRSCARALRAGSDFSRAVGLGVTLALWGLIVHSLVDFYLQSTANAALFLVFLAMLTTVARLGRQSPDNAFEFQ